MFESFENKFCDYLFDVCWVFVWVFFVIIILFKYKNIYEGYWNFKILLFLRIVFIFGYCFYVNYFIIVIFWIYLNWSKNFVKIWIIKKFIIK